MLTPLLVEASHEYWRADWKPIPSHLQSGLQAYIETGRPTGGGLRAILEDRALSYCLARLDDEVKPRVFDVVRFLFNNAPNHCWGSEEKVENWLEAGRVRLLAVQKEAGL